MVDGNKIKSDYVIVAEGACGTLTEKIFKHYNIKDVYKRQPLQHFLRYRCYLLIRLFMILCIVVTEHMNTHN